MEKKRYFLGFLASLFMIFISGGVRADGYLCPDYKKYTSCSAGYYMTLDGSYNGTPTERNECTACPAGCSCAGGTAAPVCGVTVTLDYNGGTGQLEDTEHCSGSTCTCPNNGECDLPRWTVAANPLARPGYIFMGWATSPTATTGSNSMTFTASTTIYAAWSPCNSNQDQGCSCASGTHPVNGVCTDCTVQCTGDYPLGQYNSCEINGGDAETPEQICKRECTVADVAHSLTVTGTVGMTEDAATVCAALTCEDGYTLVGTQCVQTIECTAGLMYDGVNMVDCPAGKYCPGVGTTTIGVAGCDATCPNGYTSDTGANAETQCYQECTTTCETGTCPENSTSCTWVEGTVVNGIQYYGDTTCQVAESDRYCQLNTLFCDMTYYSNNKASCDLCSAIPGYEGVFTQSPANNSSGPNVCFTTCFEPCTRPQCPENATCEYDESQNSTGGKYYPDTETCRIVNEATCDMTVTCNDGYTYDSATNTCNPIVYAITLDANGGTPAIQTIYQHPKGWFSDADATRAISVAPVPTRTDWEFLGYYTEPVDGNLVISDNLVLPANTTFNADTTLYAHWTEEIFECTERKTYDGLDCPVGMYCPGVNVIAGTETSNTNGCQRTCPVDPLGGYIQSESGSMFIDDCRTTRMNQKLPDGTGFGDQTCHYFAGSASYDRSCTTNVISCNGGYYLLNNTDITCSVVAKGAFSPDGDTHVTLCSSLAGADATVTTADTGAADATACYNTCAQLTIAHGVLTPKVNEVHFDGTSIAACEYDTICDAGYMVDPANPYSCTLCTQGSYCPGNSRVESCPATHPYSDYGTADEGKCYADCALATNAASMTGHAYKDGTSDCRVDLCVRGAYLDNAKGQCLTCQAGRVCPGDNTIARCPVNTYCPAGAFETTACPTEFPNSAEATKAESDCYRMCITSDIENATAVSGTITQGGVNTCAATACVAGTYVTPDGECGVCPENHICTGGSAAPVACPTTHPNAPEGSFQTEQCYVTCEDYRLDYGWAHIVNGTEQYPTECQYTGESDTGNPCEIVDGTKCVEKHCNPDYELIGGRCEPCDRDNAILYADGANCSITLCMTGFHPTPDGRACVENVQECPAADAIYAEQVWDFNLKAFGKCTIKECIDGYHLTSNACVLDERPCTIERGGVKIGSGVQQWNEAAQKWGECVAETCTAGYTNDPSLTNEHGVECGECKNRFSVLGEVAVSSYLPGGNCEIASCMYQGELYNLDTASNECVPICDINGYSDETGSMIWDPSRKKCVRTCNEGYVMW